MKNDKAKVKVYSHAEEDKYPEVSDYVKAMREKANKKESKKN